MPAALLILIGVVLLFVAGVGFSRPRFQPQWLGLGCLALAVTWPALNALTR